MEETPYFSSFLMQFFGRKEFCKVLRQICRGIGNESINVDIVYNWNYYYNMKNQKAVIDYSFHGVIGHVDVSILKEVEDLVAEGITSHKFYLTYGQKLTDREVFLLMKKAKELGVMLTVHPEKQLGKDNIAKIPNGAPGVELRMALVFSEGVSGGKFDLSAELTLTHIMLHENVDYTPYEGISLRGYSYMTISRGKIVAKEGRFLGEGGLGKFIKRNQSILSV